MTRAAGKGSPSVGHRDPNDGLLPSKLAEAGEIAPRFRTVLEEAHHEHDVEVALVAVRVEARLDEATAIRDAMVAGAPAGKREHPRREIHADYLCTTFGRCDGVPPRAAPDVQERPAREVAEFLHRPLEAPQEGAVQKTMKTTAQARSPVVQTIKGERSSVEVRPSARIIVHGATSLTRREAAFSPRAGSCRIAALDWSR